MTEDNSINGLIIAISVVVGLLCTAGLTYSEIEHDKAVRVAVAKANNNSWGVK